MGYGPAPQAYGPPPQPYGPPAQPYAPAQQAYAVPPTPNPFAAPEPVAYAPPPPPAPEPKAEANPVDAIAAAMTTNRAKPAPTPEELPSDEELDKMFGRERDTGAAFRSTVAVPDDEETIDEAQIEKIPDPRPLKQIEEIDDDPFDDEDIDPDEIPDPDPLPVYQGQGDDEEEDEDNGRGGLKRLVLPVVIIVLLGLLASGLVLARGMIVSVMPIANDYFYDLIGLHVVVPGDGLKRTLTRTAVETVANVDYVIANGTVTNVSDKDQPVPSIFVQLVDAKGQVLDVKEVKPEKDTLKPGEVLNFKATFEGAPPTARNVRTEWGKFEPATATPAEGAS